MAGEGRGFPLSVVQIDGHNKGEVGEALKEKKETRIFQGRTLHRQKRHDGERGRYQRVKAGVELMKVSVVSLEVSVPVLAEVLLVVLL